MAAICANKDVYNSGHFGPPLPFWAPGPPALPGLPMASYATGLNLNQARDGWFFSEAVASAGPHASNLHIVPDR